MKANNKFKFKKKLIGGVDELDVLKKIRELNKEYQFIIEKYEDKIMLLNKKIDELEQNNK